MPNHFDPQRHHRRSIRLPAWDYRTHAYYFVTICAHNRENLFEAARLAEIVAIMWPLIPKQRHAAGVFLDEWVVMPNHLHGLILLPGSATGCPADVMEEAILPGLPFDIRYMDHGRPPAERSKTLPARSLGSIIGTYKSGVTRRINALRRTPGMQVWQRGYYEHIVRDHHELARIQNYIRDNPARWAEDRENLDALLKKMVYQDE